MKIKLFISLHILFFLINHSLEIIQSLNNINTFIKNGIDLFVYLKMSNNDIIFISSSSDDKNNLYLYGLKSNGEKYYNFGNGIDYIKLESAYIGSFNAINFKIEDKEYPLICSNVECIIIDIKNNHTIFKQDLINFYKNMTEDDISLLRPLNFPIINLNQDNKILFITLYGLEGFSFNLGITSILGNFSFQNFENVYGQLALPSTINMHTLHCFITENKLIECLYYESDIYKVGIFGENLNYIHSLILEDTKINDKFINFRQSSNCIHLKNEIGIFTYYINTDKVPNPGLILQINELVLNGANYEFKPLYKEEKIFLSLDNNSFSDHNDLETDSIENKHLFKINDNKFAYIYDYYDKEANYFIVLIMFDLNGNNNENLLIKYYIFNHNLIFGHNALYYNKINIIPFNSLIGIALIPFFKYEEEYDNEPYYIIFGQSEQNIYEIEFNVTKNLTWTINDDLNISIYNNIFGYELKYKISSIDDSLQNLKIFSVNNNKELTIYENINCNDSLLFDFMNINTLVDENHIIEIVGLIIEPNFNKSIELCDLYDKYGEDPYDYYEPKIKDEKILKVKFNFECYSTCETCEYAGFNITNQKCTSCKNSNIFCFMENEGNCYNTSSSNYSFYLNSLKCISSDTIEEKDENSQIDLTEKTYPSEYTSENKKNKECLNECNYDDIINKNIIISNNPESYTKILEILYNTIKEGSLDEEIKNIIIINGNNITIEATTSNNENYLIFNNIKTNLSIIDLTECEQKLGLDKPLIILKVDIHKNNSYSPQVEYLLIHPYTHEKIDLSKCDNTKIKIYIPFNISEDHLNLYNYVKNQGYNIFNPSDSFYNDICTPFVSFNKTDVLIKDRKSDYFINEYAFCEEGCNFDYINIDLDKVICKCEIKKEIKTDTKFSPSKLFEKFYKIDSYSNYKVLVCYNLVFSKRGLKRNYGCYILSGIILAFILISIINLITNSKKVNEMLECALAQQEQLIIEISKNNQFNNKIGLEEGYNSDKNKLVLSNKSNNKKKKIKRKKRNTINININYFIKNQLGNNDTTNQSNKMNINKKTIFQNYNINQCPPKKISNINIVNIDNSHEEMKNSKKDVSIFRKKDNKDTAKTKNDKNEKMIDFIIKNIEKEKRKNYFTNKELNSLEYEYALEIDDRTYIQYYFSLLKLKHLIIFTFISNDDYNIFLLKLGFFLISFSLYFSVNAMFFTDDTIHKLYKANGKYNYLYQIPKILYSTFICAITNIFLKKLSLSQNEILKIKQGLDINKTKEKIKTTKKCLKIKFIIFTIIGFILLLFFWYYLSTFCSVFVNSQIPLLKDTIISYGLSMLYPFGLNLIPGFLRIPSLKKRNKKILYNISKIIAII